MIGYPYKQDTIKVDTSAKKLRPLKKDAPIPKDKIPMPDRFAVAWK